jgi:hypothetical protein
MSNRKAYIIGGVVIIAAIPAIILVNHFINKKMLTKLDVALKTGEGKEGGLANTVTEKGIQTGDYSTGGAGSLAGTTLLTGQQQLDISKQVYDAKNYTLDIYNKDSMAIDAFKKIKSKNQLSQVATMFSKLYSQDIYTFIQTFTQSGSQDFFTSYIKNLPLSV